MVSELLLGVFVENWHPSADNKSITLSYFPKIFWNKLLTRECRKSQPTVLFECGKIKQCMSITHNP